MEFIRSFAIILLMLILGEAVSKLLSSFIPIPGSILGLVFLFVLLQTRIVPYEKIKVSSDFFLENITFFVIPVGIMLMRDIFSLVDMLIPMLLCGVVVTMTSVVITALFIDRLKRLKK